MAKAVKKAKRKKPVTTWMVEEACKSGAIFRYLRETRREARETASWYSDDDVKTRVARVRITEI
jgi:hypothetical protein